MHPSVTKRFYVTCLEVGTVAGKLEHSQNPRHTQQLESHSQKRSIRNSELGRDKHNRMVHVEREHGEQIDHVQEAERETHSLWSAYQSNQVLEREPR